jgi:hypothetical protein
MNRLLTIYRAWTATVDRRKIERQGFGGRRASDMYPPLTGDELKARLAQLESYEAS